MKRADSKDALKSSFFQDGPVLKNPFEGDDLLRYFLRWRLPSEMLTEIEPGLVQLGQRMAGDVHQFAQQAEAQEPKHIPFDAWGRRIDEIVVSEAWQSLHRVSAEEGMIATGYERTHGEHSRVHQFVKLYLFHPSSAFYTCPVGDDRRGGARARALRYSRSENGCFQESHLAQSAAFLDFRAVDDRAHWRL